MFCAWRYPFVPVILLATLTPGPVRAHASEQGLVLLLPTDVYLAAGTASVALTVLLLAVLPAGAVRALFARIPILRMRRGGGRVMVSCLSFLLLWALIWAGLTGSHDPLDNPLPLFVWTVFWVGFVTLTGLLGNLWRWVNPWTGLLVLARRLSGGRAPFRWPDRFGHVGAIILFAVFGAVLLADPAPADPVRLANIVAGYWVFTFLAALAFGTRWMQRVEFLSVLMRSYGRVGILGRGAARLRMGVPGWQIATGPSPGPSLAVFTLMILATGSFDGLNETFWWLDLIGINPLEFPGRSAVVVQNLTGLFLANVALVCVFALALWLGRLLVSDAPPPGRAFCIFAPSILPIALGYHIAHYLPSFLVDGQYALIAANDPLGRGADLLGLGSYYVTTGFFNTQDTVRVLFLTQAGAVVGGHILAVLLAHALALRSFGRTRAALFSQVPLAAFMILYTFFGLWLLASPRGL